MVVGESAPWTKEEKEGGEMGGGGGRVEQVGQGGGERGGRRDEGGGLSRSQTGIPNQYIACTCPRQTSARTCLFPSRRGPLQRPQSEDQSPQ